MNTVKRFFVIVLLLLAIAPLAFNRTPTLALDESPLLHNSRDLVYRNPFGAVTTGTMAGAFLAHPATHAATHKPSTSSHRDSRT